MKRANTELMNPPVNFYPSGVIDKLRLTVSVRSHEGGKFVLQEAADDEV